MPGVMAESSRLAPWRAVRRMGPAGLVTTRVTSAVRISAPAKAVAVMVPR